MTWSYSASANETSGGVSQPDPSLPNGVLEFFSNGSLAQSTNVGGSLTGATDTVTHAAYGSESVDVVYESGSNSATTGTETYDITNPVLLTTTTLNVGQQDNFSTTPVSASVVDQNGNAVAAGTVSYQLAFSFQGTLGTYGPYTVTAITAPVGTTCYITDLQVSEGSYYEYQVSSATPGCTGGGTYVASTWGTNPPSSITPTATYSGATHDLGSSAQATYP